MPFPYYYGTVRRLGRRVCRGIPGIPCGSATVGNYVSNQVSYRHTQRVVVRAAMEDGGCGREFGQAVEECGAGRKRTAEEVQDCIRWTSLLRQCMQCNERSFKNYIRLMDQGLDQDEGKERRYRRLESEQDRWRWRWWTGMIRVPERPPVYTK